MLNWNDSYRQQQLAVALVICCPPFELIGDKFLHIAPLTCRCVLEEEQSENRRRQNSREIISNNTFYF